jgi:amidase
LESLGHDIEISHPSELDSNFFHSPGFVLSAAAHIVFQVRELEGQLGRELGESDLEPMLLTCMQLVGGLRASDLQQALHERRLAAVRYGSWWDAGFDLLLTPTIAVPPYPLGSLKPSSPDEPFADVAAWVPFTPHANATGFPAISLPLYHNAQGLPIGIQLVASYGRDDLLIGIASQVEEARPWADDWPPIAA